MLSYVLVLSFVPMFGLVLVLSYVLSYVLVLGLSFVLSFGLSSEFGAVPASMHPPGQRDGSRQYQLVGLHDTNGFHGEP